MSPGRPTLRQVAELAGVSIKTASRALRGEPRVSADTRRAVQRAAHELGFRVNTMASSLRGSGVSSLIGLVIPDISDPFYATLALAVERTAEQHAYGLILASHHEDSERERMALESMISNRVAALIEVPASESLGYLAAEVALGTPIVLVDRPAQGIEADTVLAANRDGVRQVMLRLLAQGHHRIALLSKGWNVWTQTQRLNSYRDALAEAGLPFDDRYVVAAEGIEGSEAAVTSLLELPDPPSAIFSINVPMLIGALRALRRAGADVALASFDDHPMFAAIASPILVVRQDPDRMGVLAAEIALGRLRGDETPPRRVVMPVEYVEAGGTR